MGWWPQTEPPGPAFYAYTYPEPNGFRTAPVRPAGAYFDEPLGLFMLPYSAVRNSSDPDAAVQDFLESTYQAGANLAGWDRPRLEPAVHPERPPRKPWSVLGTGSRP
jgi:hypothetical protein